MLHGTVKVFTMIKTAAALQCSILSLYYHAVLPSSRMLEFPPKFEYKASPQAGGRPSILTMEFDFRVEFCTHVLQSLSLPCHVKQQRNLDMYYVQLSSTKHYKTIMFHFR